VVVDARAVVNDQNAWSRVMAVFVEREVSVELVVAVAISHSFAIDPHVASSVVTSATPD
jgi:hypothetical protein